MTTTASNARPHVLREYSLIADGERGALIGPAGEMAWMCFPAWDDEGLFSALIGGRGLYSVRPSGRFVWGGWYEPGSLIWRSRWVTDEHAILECREALALPSSGRRAVILRRLCALEGSMRVEVELQPRSGFGAHGLLDVERRDDGGWQGRTGSVHIGWWGAEDARRAEGEGGLTIALDLAEGEEHDLVLVASCEPDPPRPDASACWSATEAAWQERVPRLGLAVADRDARHAWAVLSGLTSASGGMVAAVTAALPERADAGRSFDYRYVWIRDQTYAGRAVATAGPHELFDGAIRFVRDRLLDDGAQMMPAYTTSGDRVPDEHELALPGYPGGTDIVGNWVNGQFQLDAFGEALLLFAAAGRDRLDADTWRAAEIAAGAIERRWQEPDAGIWELDPDEWTESRLIAAAGLRAISDCGPGGEQAARWLSLADAIVADTSSRALHPSGRWQRSPTDDRIDAALLLPALRGAVSHDDPRSVATLHAVLSELTEDGYAYRYRIDGRPLGEAEGSFLFCGFLLALFHLQRGEHVQAARWFERTRAACGPPGLLSEEFDVRQRQLRGNLPQAFVHAVLLECALEQERVASAS